MIQRGNDTVKNVVHAAELIGPLHGDHIPRLRHHADQAVVPGIVGADRAKLPIRQILADRAGLDGLLGRHNRVGKGLGLPFRQTQHIKGKALGRFAADTGQAGKLIGKVL